MKFDLNISAKQFNIEALTGEPLGLNSEYDGSGKMGHTETNISLTKEIINKRGLYEPSYSSEQDSKENLLDT